MKRGSGSGCDARRFIDWAGLSKGLGFTKRGRQNDAQCGEDD